MYKNVVVLYNFIIIIIMSFLNSSHIYFWVQSLFLLNVFTTSYRS